MSRPKRMLISGWYGNLAQAMRSYMAANHPEVDLVRLHPNPFNLEYLKSVLDYGADWFVNLASKGSSEESKHPDHTYTYWDTNVTGVIKQMEMLKRYAPNCRYLNVGSIYERQSDNAVCDSPYVATKVVSAKIVSSYRCQGLWAVQPQLGFTEWYERHPTYLSRKIVQAAVRIKRAIERGDEFAPLVVRDIHQRFVWSWADDVAEGMWRMLNQSAPVEQTLMSGEVRTLGDFVELTFAEAGLMKPGVTGQWKPRDWVGFDFRAWSNYGFFDEQGRPLLTLEFTDMNPPEPIVDTSAHTALDWHPKWRLKDIVATMTARELAQTGPQGPESPRSKAP